MMNRIIFRQNGDFVKCLPLVKVSESGKKLLAVEKDNDGDGFAQIQNGSDAILTVKQILRFLKQKSYEAYLFHFKIKNMALGQWL